MSKRETRPRWLETLLENTFFEVCHEHRDLRESKINIFCIDCGLCFCTHCFSGSSHAPHRHLQIRHNMYQDVVEVDDLNKLFDCSKIQTYKNNGKRAVYLNPKVQSRPSKSNGGTGGGGGGGGGGPQCVVCKIRITESTNLFCSIACKISEEGVNNNDSSPTSHLEAEEAFPPPSSSSVSQERGEHSMDGSDEGTVRPKKRIRRRKGVPHRSPLF